MKTPNLLRDTSLEIAMTPMIDVVFLLLIFFVWTSSFEAPESDLPSSVAAAEKSGGGAESNAEVPSETFDEILIGISVGSLGMQISMNQEPIGDLDALRKRMSEILMLGVQPPVIIDPEPMVLMADAVAVFDTARAAGADRVLFAIEE
jgi:biopolymer transport protein ExbD